jgi:hypothetical protein
MIYLEILFASDGSVTSTTIKTTGSSGAFLPNALPWAANSYLEMDSTNTFQKYARRQIGTINGGVISQDVAGNLYLVQTAIAGRPATLPEIQ